MSRPNPSFQKRLREQKKRLKREDKVKRKAERDEAKRLGITTEADPNDYLPDGPEEPAED